MALSGQEGLLAQVDSTAGLQRADLPKSNVVDLRQNNGRARADASISVDQLFFEMYNSAAELLPGDPSCHVEDIDNSIDADERPAASAVPTLQPHPKFHQMLPILGWDPSQTFLQDVMTASMDEQDLPIRYIQNQKPIDLWWQYPNCDSLHYGQGRFQAMLQGKTLQLGPLRARWATARHATASNMHEGQATYHITWATRPLHCF